MKTQKQLPNEFTFFCDEHSREQLEKLGVELNWYKITKEDYGDYYIVKDNKIINMGYSYESNDIKEIHPNAVFVDLADYIEQEQPENSIKFTNFGTNNDFYTQSTRLEFKTDGNRIPIGQKWQDKTRGGMEFFIFEYFDNSIFGRIKVDKEWIGLHWRSDGKYYETANDVWDLIPINHELTTLEKELEEVRLKEKELLKKIEELKTK